MHKNRLQEYTQRSSIPLPVYQTTNEGSLHAPRFRSTVLVDGTSYTSLDTFSHRKAAEQDAAKVALDCITKKIKDEGCPIIREVCCIMLEFLVFWVQITTTSFSLFKCLWVIHKGLFILQLSLSNWYNIWILCLVSCSMLKKRTKFKKGILIFDFDGMRFLSLIIRFLYL